MHNMDLPVTRHWAVPMELVPPPCSDVRFQARLLISCLVRPTCSR
jgi:hypothetical protein